MKLQPINDTLLTAVHRLPSMIAPVSYTYFAISCDHERPTVSLDIQILGNMRILCIQDGKEHPVPESALSRSTLLKQAYFIDPDGIVALKFSSTTWLAGNPDEIKEDELLYDVIKVCDALYFVCVFNKDCVVPRAMG
jgi:hypothetical protein